MSSPRRVPSTRSSISSARKNSLVQGAPWFNEFTIFGAFVVVALFGVIYGGVVAVMSVLDRQQVAAEAVPPSVEVFRVAVGEAAGPFLWQVSKSGVGMFEGDTELSIEFAKKTRESVLAINESMKIPAAESVSYLQLVLLLDRWERALGKEGTVDNRAAVVADTQAFVLENSWAVPAL